MTTTTNRFAALALAAATAAAGLLATTAAPASASTSTGTIVRSGSTVVVTAPQDGSSTAMRVAVVGADVRGPEQLVVSITSTGQRWEWSGCTAVGNPSRGLQLDCGAGVTSIEARFHDGDDRLELAPDVAARLFAYGGDGDDRLVGGTGNDYLFGEGGDDHLRGHTGLDSVVGGQGFDTCQGAGWIVCDAVEA